MLPAITHAADAWASVYSNSAALRTGLTFAHIAGLVAAGGSAVVEDRGILRSVKADAGARVEQLRRLRGVHRVVIIGLTVVMTSGLLLFLADFDTYLHSQVFWAKMLVVLLLLANGALMVWAGRRAESGHPTGWAWLTRASLASLTLWTMTTLLGAALPNV